VLVERTLASAPGRSQLSLRVERATEARPALLVAEWFPSMAALGAERAPGRVLVDGVLVADAPWKSAPCEDCDRFELPVEALALGEGLRLVTVEFDVPGGRVRQRSTTVRESDGRAIPRRAGPRGPDGTPRLEPRLPFAHWFPESTPVAWRVEHLFRDTLPGRPLVVGERVYLGDALGRVHALDLGADEPRSARSAWTSRPVGMAIESAPALAGELLVVGAWDGNVHAFDAQTGERKWSKPGPKSSEGGAARYYAPADCSPVVLQDRIYVCDRGYMLAWYSLTGEMHVLSHANVAAIGASADGANLYLRGTDDVLARIDRDGAVVWSAKVPLGRAPVPPVEKDGVVHVVSDQGLWSRVDARTGAVLGTIPTSATAYVFAPPILGDDGSVEIRSQAGTRFLSTPARARPASPEPAGPR